MIDRCHVNKIHLGEDTITTFILDSIVSVRSSSFVVEDTRADESTKGCDFELWIGCDLHGWIRYAVQAKKITPSSGRYESIKHFVKSAKKLQIDILDLYSQTNRAFPIYCFYNITIPPSSLMKPWSKTYKWNCCDTENEYQFGCSVTPLSVVRDAFNRKRNFPKDFKSFHSHPETLPWACLVKCKGLCNSDKTLLSQNSSKNFPEWDGVTDHIHKKLPEELSRLREQDLAEANFDKLQGLYDPEINLKPSWIGVIDLSRD